MTAHELVELHDELERELQKSGPVQFIRSLAARAAGGQILAQEARPLGDRRRSTRFVYRDANFGEASLTVITELDDAGQTQYWLQCSESAAPPPLVG